MRRTFHHWQPSLALVTLVSGFLLTAAVVALAGQLALPVWAEALGGGLVGLAAAATVRRTAEQAAPQDVTEPRVLRLLVETFETVVTEQSATLAELEQRLRDAQDDQQVRQTETDSEDEANRRRIEMVEAALGHLQGPAAGARVEAAVGRLGVGHAFARPSLAALPAAGVSAPPRSAPAEPSAATTQVVLPVPPPQVEAAPPRRGRLFRSRAA